MGRRRHAVEEQHDLEPFAQHREDPTKGKGGGCLRPKRRVVPDIQMTCQPIISTARAAKAEGGKGKGGKLTPNSSPPPTTPNPIPAVRTFPHRGGGKGKKKKEDTRALKRNTNRATAGMNYLRYQPAPEPWSPNESSRRIRRWKGKGKRRIRLKSAGQFLGASRPFVF